MFTCKTATAKEWKTLVKAITTVVEEATFEATPETLTFRAMDSSHVALLDVTWPKGGFEKWECDKGTKFTVRVVELSKLFARADAEDSVEITVSGEDKVNLKFEGSYPREFTLNLIETTNTPTPLPKLSFNSRFTIEGGQLQKILEDALAVADHITLETTTGAVTFNGKSESGSLQAMLDKNHTNLIDLNVVEPSKSTYSPDYLIKVVKALSPEKVTVEYSSKMPLRLETDLSEIGGKIHFYLAPRIENRD